MPGSLERYFKALQATIAAAAHVAISGLTFESRSPSIGFARGDVHFADGSLLHFRELLDVQKVVPRLMYVYHYQRADGVIIFVTTTRGTFRLWRPFRITSMTGMRSMSSLM
jgi:hypothetical protein